VGRSTRARGRPPPCAWPRVALSRRGAATRPPGRRTSATGPFLPPVGGAGSRSSVAAVRYASTVWWGRTPLAARMTQPRDRMVSISRPASATRRRSLRMWVSSDLERGAPIGQTARARSARLTSRSKCVMRCETRTASVGDSGAHRVPNRSRPSSSRVGSTVRVSARHANTAARWARSAAGADAQIQSSSASGHAGGASSSATTSRRGISRVRSDPSRLCSAGKRRRTTSMRSSSRIPSLLSAKEPLRAPDTRQEIVKIGRRPVHVTAKPNRRH
jgi:hypothetical protein